MFCHFHSLSFLWGCLTSYATSPETAVVRGDWDTERKKWHCRGWWEEEEREQLQSRIFFRATYDKMHHSKAKSKENVEQKIRLLASTALAWFTKSNLAIWFRVGSGHLVLSLPLFVSRSSHENILERIPVTKERTTAKEMEIGANHFYRRLRCVVDIWWNWTSLFPCLLLRCCALWALCKKLFFLVSSP